MLAVTTHFSPRGFALLGALLLLLMLSAMAVGLVFIVSSEVRLGGTDRENTLAYYGAEAGMEQMIAELSALYGKVQNPGAADINALETRRPALPGIEYAEYDISPPGASVTRPLSGGPHVGLIAIITPVTLSVTARGPGGAEVKMRREVEVAQIPIFQFARFSESDLSEEPGPEKIVGGRVHTNGNLFVSSGSNLVYQSKVTAVGEVVRDVRINGTPVAGGAVWMPTATTGCTGSTPPYGPNCREFARDEGSVTEGLAPPVANPQWQNISTGSPPFGFNGNLLNGATGAHRLDLPFMEPGSSLRRIELIRRPLPSEDPSSPAAQSRLYNKAQIRVLLSDSPADLPGGSADAENVRLANLAGTAYPAGVTIGGSLYYFATGKDGGSYADQDWLKPLRDVTGAAIPAGGTWPLLDGWLRVEIRRTDGSYLGVTREWLELGFARSLAIPNSETGAANSVHPNAILILQVQNDRNADGAIGAGDPTLVSGANSEFSWLPINLYDAREGETVGGTSSSTCAVGGIINLVEIDVGNLRRWLFGTLPGSGTQVEDRSQNGFILYFSDRRGMIPNPHLSPPAIVGEYGFEDTANTNGVFDNPQEDVNENGQLDQWGKANLGDGFLAAAQGGDTASDHPTTRVACVGVGKGGADKGAARKNRVSGARHAVRLMNGSLGNLPTRRPATPAVGGFTLVSENPVYVFGNYNASQAAGFGDPHADAAIITDVMPLLSRNWSDLASFQNPTNRGGRPATDSWYRMAILGGMNRLSGGSLIGYLEDWNNRTQHWTGSMVNLYWNEYFTGLVESPNITYRPPTRDWSFDSEFLLPENLPPGTPMLRDVVNLGFRQVFRAD